MDAVDPTSLMNTDTLIAYRMTEMEKDNKELNKKVDKVQEDVSALKDSITSEFAALKKTLFERPLFVTFDLLKVELESRDRALANLEASKNKDIADLKETISNMSANTVSTARHYSTLGVAMLGVFVAPFVSDYLGRI